MVMTMWDGKPGTFKQVWLGNLRQFILATNDFASWLNDDIGLFNDYSLKIDLALPDGFGRDRRLKILDQIKEIRAFLTDIEKMLNDSSYQEYDDDGRAVPYRLVVDAMKVPLTNDAKNYNALFKELDRDLTTMNSFKDENKSDN